MFCQSSAVIDGWTPLNYLFLFKTVYNVMFKTFEYNYSLYTVAVKHLHTLVRDRYILAVMGISAAVFSVTISKRTFLFRKNIHHCGSFIKFTESSDNKRVGCI